MRAKLYSVRLNIQGGNDHSKPYEIAVATLKGLRPLVGGMADDRVQTNIRLDQETKEEWNEYADEHGYKSVASLIRVAVKEKIQGAQGGEGQTTAADPSEAMESVENRLERLETAVEDATNAMMTAESPIDTELATTVWEAIPEGPTEATTAEGIAEGLREDATTVRVALEQLETNSPTVRRIDKEVFDSDTSTVEWEGQEIEVPADDGYNRLNPRFFKDVS